MQAFLQFLSRLFGTVLRLSLWLLTVLLALGLLALALLLLLGGALWALVRGQRPAPSLVVTRFQRYASQRVWPGRNGQPPAAASHEVVDVEVREVDDAPPAAPPPGPPRPLTPP
jgi:hypothetical protein